MQEALTQRRQARASATRVEVRVSDRDGDIALLVRDDGRGFDPQQRSGGFGLLGMRERLALVGGTLDDRIGTGRRDRAAGDDPGHAPRIRSTEHGAGCATRSLTPAGADSPASSADTTPMTSSSASRAYANSAAACTAAFASSVAL